MELLKNLAVGPDGIWRAKERTPVSYPEEGNSECFVVESRSFWFGHRNDCILSTMKSTDCEGPVVDVGGGNGFVTERMLREGYEAILLEPGPTGASNAKRRRLPMVVCSTWENARFDSECLGGVGVFDVLEHIEDDYGFVDGLRLSLKPGGFLFATVPAHGWLWSQADIDADHFRRYTLKSLTALLERGFDIKRITYFFQPLVVPLMLLRSAPFRLGLTRRRSILSTEKEHGAGGGIGSKIMTRLLRREFARIQRGEALITGTSLLVAAKKRG